MTLERLSRLLDAYGSDPRRWPQGDRADAEALILESSAARQLHARAQALDQLLDVVTSHPADDRLRRRVLDVGHSASGRAAQKVAISDWILGAWWPQVAALAAAAVLGVFIGTRVLPPPTDRTAESEVADWVFGSDLTEGVDR